MFASELKRRKRGWTSARLSPRRVGAFSFSFRFRFPSAEPTTVFLGGVIVAYRGLVVVPALRAAVHAPQRDASREERHEVPRGRARPPEVFDERHLVSFALLFPGLPFSSAPSGQKPSAAAPRRQLAVRRSRGVVATGGYAARRACRSRARVSSTDDPTRGLERCVFSRDVFLRELQNIRANNGNRPGDVMKPSRARTAEAHTRARGDMPRAMATGRSATSGRDVSPAGESVGTAAPLSLSRAVPGASRFPIRARRR